MWSDTRGSRTGIVSNSAEFDSARSSNTRSIPAAPGRPRGHPAPALPASERPAAARTVKVEDLGRTVRRVRTRLDLTVEDVAERAGLSAGSISQLERGHGNPSFTTITRLAEALGLTAADLLTPSPPNGSEVVRDGNRALLPEYEGGAGVVRELLTPGLNYPLQVIRTVLPPGASNEAKPFRHIGTETAFVLEGVLDVVVGGDRHRLHAGDAVTYDCTRPHWWANPSERETVILGVTVPLSR